MIFAQRKLRPTMQHVYGHNGNLGNNVLTMPLHLVHLGSSQATTLPLVGFTLTLMLLRVLMAVTALMRSWNDHSTFEQLPRRLTRTGFSDGFSHRVHRVLCALHVSYGHVFFLLSGFSLSVVVFPTSDGPTVFIRVYNIEYRRPLRAEYVESSIGVAFPRAGKWYRRLLSRGNRRGHDRIVCHFALDLLCYKVVACMILHDVSSGTTHGVSLRLWHHCHSGDIIFL